MGTYLSGISLKCLACGPIVLNLEEQPTADTPVICPKCEAKLTTFGELAAAIEAEEAKIKFRSL